MNTKARPFMDTLRDIEAGGLLDELTEAQHSLIDAIRMTGKGGDLTIKLTYKPDDAIRMTGKGGDLTIKLTYKPDGGGQMTVKADVKTKEPVLARGTSLFFLTPEGNITRRDPRQQEIPLRSVEDEPGPGALRQVSQ